MPDVTIYEHANFSGLSQVLPKGRYDDSLNQISIGNDKLTSLHIPPGLVARLYEHFKFQGRFIDLDEDTPDISRFWNDRISSIIVYGDDEPPPFTNEVVIFEHSDYGGKFQVLTPQKYNTAEILIGNNMLSSAFVPYGMVLRIYDQPNFQGPFIELRSDTPAVRIDWNDKASSIIVYEAPVGLWKICNANVGLLGESTECNGVRGISHAAGVGGDAAAVAAINDNTGPGVFGSSAGVGVWGESKTWMGVFGQSFSTTGGAGVMGEAVGSGVMGISRTWVGVYGETQNPAAVGAGVWGEHKGDGTGVFGVSKSGIGVLGKGGRLAGYFDGDVEVTGDIRLANADCAEDFDIHQTEKIEPGTVMVLGNKGKLQQSQEPYDKRVAGVVSGAGAYKPGIVLDKRQSENNRQPIALLGKVYCKVDAKYGPIEIGDLLTTSPSRGCAMKASDPLKAFGAVIGKALEPFSRGVGMIPILVTLQ